MPKIILVFIIAVCMTFSTAVHQDRLLKLDKHGDIHGLPKEYAPANFNGSDGVLMLGGKEITFPSCIFQYFQTSSNPDLQLSASWYHSKEIMPYYVKFRSIKKLKGHGYQILIDLKTLEVIQISELTKKGKSYSQTEITPDAGCITEYLSKIKN